MDNKEILNEIAETVWDLVQSNLNEILDILLQEKT